METLLSSFALMFDKTLILAPRMILALVVFFGCIGLGRFLGRILVRVFVARNGAKVYLSFLQQLTTWLLALLGLILALNILGLGSIAMSLLAGGGMAAVVFGFAFREIGENFIAGFFLTFSRSFEVGDQIESDGLSGEVKNIELRNVHIRAADGCDIFIPTAQIFKSPLYNYTRDGLRRQSFVVGIDYANDPEGVRAMLCIAAQGVNGALAEPPVAVGISALLAQYIELQVDFWMNTFDQNFEILTVKNQVIDRCCQALKVHGVIISSECSSNINLGSTSPVTIHLEGQDQHV